MEYNVKRKPAVQINYEEEIRREERKRIGQWLDEHVMYALLKADMEGYEFKAVIQNLKQGKLPGDMK